MAITAPRSSLPAVSLAELFALPAGFRKDRSSRTFRAARDEAGVKVCVFNAPEILTNSSSIFQGVEVALYPLLGAFRKEAPDHPVTRKLLAEVCRSAEARIHARRAYRTHRQLFPLRHHPALDKFEQWPQHNAPSRWN
jgi:hypothetical protein